MGLFSKADEQKINEIAKKSKTISTQSKKKTVSTKNIATELQTISRNVEDYFKDSKAELITSVDALHRYISECIKAGIAGIDTETTGLDRINDTIVGASLYYPGGVEVYIPSKHLVPIFDVPYKNQLTYEEIGKEFQRLKDAGVKLIFANADYDLAMIYKDLKVDFIPNCYYDVIIAWRCLKENERHNGLKALYNKYVLKGHGDPKAFSDFFPVSLFPYCKPEVAKLYAANDAKITYDLYRWQLPYVTKTHDKCKKNHLEAIADLVWNIEFPLIACCQNMHRRGVYIDTAIIDMLRQSYLPRAKAEKEKLIQMVSEIISDPKYKTSSKMPFKTATEFNPDSVPHVAWLCYDCLGFEVGKDGKATGKEILSTFNHPITNQILTCRSLTTLIGTFVEKLPNTIAPDGRIHCQFKQIGAATGRMSSAEPNLQNIPSKHNEIRHMFRATPGYVLISSDFSQQEPKLTAYVSQDENMIRSFQENKDIYSFIASIAFNKTYEECREFTPTGEYNPEGKARRSEAKSVVLGILYGRSVKTIADQLYSHEPWTPEKRVKTAQFVYDSVLDAFPSLRKLMVNSKKFAVAHGYVETILGRRRHIPEMQLPEYEFKPLPGYVNPDIDPMDISTLDNSDDIPARIKEQLYKELKSYKYFGQRSKRIRRLYEDEHIKVISNSYKIAEGERQVVNSIIQGSAADLTKMAMLKVENDPVWNALGGRVLIPVHDEFIAEIPIEHYKEGGERLAKMMCDAAGFLPFSIKCDVETTIHWYGLSYPCPYTRPATMDIENLTPDEIKYIQYYLFESGYELPIYKGKDGKKPEGDEAHGVNGVISEEMKSFIFDYCSRYNIVEDDFIEHVTTTTITGYPPERNKE